MSEGTILIVEDNDVMREGLEDMLTFEGFDSISAGDGKDALHKMERFTPDLILADIAMPVMDGYEFYEAVRKQAEWITIPFIFLTARADRNDIIAGKNLGVEDYLVKPISREELFTSIRAKLARTRQIQMAQLKNAYEASMKALAKAIELRDPYTGGHVERVTDYAMALGIHLNWSERRLENLRYGAILHDIGKIHIHKSTLLKSSLLDEEEMEEMRQHPIIGAEMIAGIPYLTGAVPIVRSHHERWDGKGYPDRLSGDNIPGGARVVAVVDAFDAMVTERPYSSARDLHEAYEELMRCAGERYDPQVIAAFQVAWENGEIQAISKKY